MKAKQENNYNKNI